MDMASINDRLLFSFPEHKTDVGIAFGARSTSGEVARHTADLYHRGAFESIILTGGIKVSEPLVLGLLSLNFVGAKSPKLNFSSFTDFLSGQTEAAYMRDVLLERDVPESAIIAIDESSRNTGQNVENIKANLTGLGSASIITTAYSQRRAIGTMRFHDELDNLKLVPFPVYPFGFTRDNWSETPIKHLVALEAERIDENSPKTYVGQFCHDPDIEAEIEFASSLPTLEN